MHCSNCLKTPLFLILLASQYAQAGFLVETFEADGFQVQDLATAEALIAGQGLGEQASTCTQVINFDEEGRLPGRFAFDALFPGRFPTSFAARIGTVIHIDEPGDYTFATINDDGVRLTIDDAVLIENDAIHSARIFFGTTFLETGDHTVDLLFFDFAFTGALEFFAAKGSFNTFNDAFRLVGDTANGGIGFADAGTCTIAPTSSSDRDALVEFYDATNGDTWRLNAGWRETPLGGDGFNDDPCAPPFWFGVGCEHGRVTVLWFFENQLGGPIPTALADLGELRTLTLSGNGITGGLPPELAQLAKLQRMRLSSEELTGAIPPQFSQLTHLKSLSLSGNLTGPIPPELGNLALLQSLGLGDGITGSVPGELGDLAALRALFLKGNQLTGEIPATLGNLNELMTLDLSDNLLTGTIPATLGNLAGLETLTLSNNRLSGNLPVELANLASLGYLVLSNNQLAGAIPPELGDLADIKIIDLGRNRLTGAIPPELGNLESLEWLVANDNHLTGSIPSQLGNLTLDAMDLSNNLLTGSIPPELGDNRSAFWIRLSNNQLSGEVPSRVATLRFDSLDIRQNRLDSVTPGFEDNLEAAQVSDSRFESLQSVSAVYPQLAIGAGFEVVLMVSSRSSLPWTGRAYLDGGSWPPETPWQWNGQDMTGETSFPVTLEPQATQKFVLGSSSETTIEGWLSLTAEGDSSPGDVSSAFFYNLNGEAGLIDSTGIGPSAFSDHFFFPVERSSIGSTVMTGLAFRSVEGSVSISLFDAEGEFIAQERVFGDGSALIGDLCTDLPTDFVGSAQIFSSFPFYLTVVRVQVTEAGVIQLTSVPATLVP